ncbi:MAG: hypothetical protein H6R35_346 [Bacteroidetes bacterium]|nr:hypothetical protein [Bacteroidota bacterium]
MCFDQDLVLQGFQCHFQRDTDVEKQAIVPCHTLLECHILRQLLMHHKYLSICRLNYHPSDLLKYPEIDLSIRCTSLSWFGNGNRDQYAIFPQSLFPVLFCTTLV